MRKLLIIVMSFCLIAGCSKTTQLTHITDPILEDKHQAVAANPEAPSCWSLYWKWGVVAFVGITGLILGYRHREELSSAYHNARLNYMKNADFRFFPDETNPQNKPPANNLPMPQPNMIEINGISLPIASHNNYKLQRGLFAFEYDIHKVWYHRNGFLYEASQEMIDAAKAIAVHQ